MSDTHPDLGPELRALAQMILDRIDPAVRAAAAAAAGAEGSGKCQQVWCPVCALAALVTGQQHPLLSVIADSSPRLPNSSIAGVLKRLSSPGMTLRKDISTACAARSVDPARRPRPPSPCPT